jgi:hypothetical protein
MLSCVAVKGDNRRLERNMQIHRILILESLWNIEPNAVVAFFN